MLSHGKQNIIDELGLKITLEYVSLMFNKSSTEFHMLLKIFFFLVKMPHARNGRWLNVN